ncbi:Starch-binding associating with outer membrane [Flaviramulus basaltis]|uniref:Starch-binding associating with outer membrane n=1 Tax=Flaviramulus basaltis TaxID=369401 RepID=A0A1K2IMV8_9FLAO|nr:RagB/SusD family nutrient uptake outer membrane protein [Flaviramulus basaltis]SFZ93586.1 Starch-binding associating with outer membrane [Flaviramulus basaltis]
MKNFLTYSLLLCFVVLNSCEDYLDKAPSTQLTESQVFANEQSLETAINGMYYTYGEYNYHGASVQGLLAPISGIYYSSQNINSDATGLNCLPNNTWLIRLWPAMYETINVANVIIAKLENSSNSLENRESALAQAYFIRAATYFDLVRLFGGVPLRTSPSTSETIHLAKSSKSDAYDLVISDFEKAKQMLPEIGENIIGKPSKYAANVYLSKVYMTLAGEDGGDSSLWQNAYDELIPVYGKFSLVSTFASLFELGNENTQESIFEIQYGHNGASRNFDAIRQFTPVNSTFVPVGQVTYGFLRPNKETFDNHFYQYPEDPRIDVTFLYNSYIKNGNFRTIYPIRTTTPDGFPALRKYFDETYNGTTTNRNFIKLRYADVLLMLAEIQNELTGPEDAYQYVNEVLTRARNTDEGPVLEPADWSGMSKDEFRLRVLKERQYELLGEGHEWFDTRRRGFDYLLNEVIIPHNENPTRDPARDFIYPTSEKNMLLPIPSNEISGNQEVSQEDQNPGY